MKNKPEDVDIVEWHYMMLYFGSEKFQVCCFISFTLTIGTCIIWMILAIYLLIHFQLLLFSRK